MSFGFSFTDFVKVTELAWKVYRSCKDAGGDFLEISREVNTLHTVLKEVQDESNNDISPLNRRGTCRKPELTTLVDNTENVLKELEDIVDRYQGLGRKQKDVWIRARFATERLDSIRGKLTFHISAIGLFMSSLSTGALGCIEEILDDLVKEVRAGKREPSIISAHETNDVTIWQELVTELALEGISRQEIARYKEDIKTYLKRVVGNSRSKPPSPTDAPTDVQLDGDDNNWESISQCLVRTEGLDTAESRGKNTGDLKKVATVARLWYKSTHTSANLVGVAGGGNLTLVKQLLRKGASITAKYGIEGVTALHEAAFAGHEAVVQLLLDHGAEVDAKTDSRRSALHYAALVGHEEVARLLLERGANADVKANRDYTPLHFAAVEGNDQVVRLLLRGGPTLQAKNSQHETPLMLAIKYRHLSVVKALMEADLRAGVTGDCTVRDLVGYYGQSGMMVNWVASQRCRAICE